VTSFGQPNVPAVMSLQVAPAAAVINSNIALTATMQDVYGNPVVNGQTVVYTSTLGGSSFSPASPNTAANGVVTASLTSTAAGTSTVTVKAGAAVQTAVVTFTAPRLRAVKTVNRNLVSPGDTLVYTITLTNGGDSDAGGVSITDTLDGQTAFVSALPAPVLTSPLVFSLGTLAPGISRTVVLTAAVTLDAVDQSVLRNAITATAIQTATAATAVATATVRGPAFAVAKSVAPQTAVAGQPLTFTIVYTSSGAVPVGGLRLTDTVPAGITVQNVSAPAGNVALVGQTVVFSRPAPFNGVGVITISGQLTAAPWPATPLTLTNRATATINVNPTRFVVTAPVRASSGPPAVITITAVPSRTLINTSVAITAEIADRYGNPITNGQTVSFSSTLAGSSITPSSAPSAGGQVAAGLTSTAAGVTTVIVQVGSISRTAVVTFTAPSLALSKTGFPNPVAPGGTVVYTLVVSNTGNAAINNVVVTDSLGSGLAFMSAAPPPSGGSGNSRTFTLGSLGTGVTQTIVLTASVSAGEGAIVQNTASAKATETSLVQVTADTLVSAAPLSLSKSGAPDPVQAGGTLTYTISYRNNTGILLNNIRLTDTLPANFSLTAVNPGNASTVTVGPSRLVFTRSGLFPLAQESIVVVGQVPASPVPAGGMFITNAVTAALQLATAPLAAEAGVQVRPAAPASIVITASTLSTTVGSVVAITATVNDPFGNPAFNGTSVTFNTSATNTFVTSPQTTTHGSAVAALSATAAATTTVTANSGSAAGNSVQVVFNTAPVVMRPVYLPLILKRFTPPPPPVDLVVDSIAVSPAAPTTSQPVVISVTIRNTGTTAASGFWVDLYLTTEPVTPTINQLWNDLGSLGVAWQVPALAGGQAITLTNLAPNNYSNPADCQNYSYFTPEAVGLCTWPGNSNIFPAAGTYFATAQVDSFGEDSTPADGEVTETDESNNVFSTPVTIIVTGTPKTPAAPSRFPFAVPATPGRVRPPLR
ncbi:MAG: beta strand repeat-containing protein, partial [Anaerolineae bacterium]